MFWENFVELCNKKGESPNKVCATLGYSTATATKWKNGAQPRSTTIMKIADYFGVPVQKLIEEEKVTASEFEKNLIEAYKAHPEHQASINALLGISPADNITKLQSDSKPVYIAAASGNEYEATEPDAKTLIEIEKLQKKHNK